MLKSLNTGYKYASLLWLCVLCLVGCQSVEEGMKPLQLKAIETSVELNEVWANTVGKGQKTIYSAFKVAVIGDVMYAADDAGTVFAYAVETGQQLWKKKLKTKLSGAIGGANGVLAVTAVDGDLIALNAEDGKELWRNPLSSEAVVPPATDGKIIIVPTIDGRLFAFDVKTGKQVWSYDHPKPILSYRSQAAPVIDGGQVFAAFDNGQLMSFSAAGGEMRWAARVSQPQGNTELERTVDLDSTPVVAGPFVYAAGLNGRIAAVNRGTGRIMWAQDISTFYDIAVANETIVTSDEESHIKAYDASTGELLWENKELHRRGTKAPSILGDYVIVIDDSNHLHILLAKDGSIVGRKKLLGHGHAGRYKITGDLYKSRRKGSTDGYDTPPLILDDKVLLFGNSGALTVYTASEVEIKETQASKKKKAKDTLTKEQEAEAQTSEIKTSETQAVKTAASKKVESQE